MAFGLPSLPSFLSLGSSREVSSTSHESTAGKSNGGDAVKSPGQNTHQPSGALAGLAGKSASSRSGKTGFKVGPKIKLSANTRNAISSAKSRNLESNSMHGDEPAIPHHAYGNVYSHFSLPETPGSSSMHHSPSFEHEDDAHSLMSSHGGDGPHGPSGPGGPGGPNGPDGPDEPHHTGHETPVETARADSNSMVKESLELSRINMQTNNILAQIQNRIQLNMSQNQMSEQLGKNAKSLTQG